MIHEDKQYGKPYVMFKLTKAQIENIPGLEVGSFAMAQDANEIGYLSATGWQWITASGIVADDPDAIHLSIPNEFNGVGSELSPGSGDKLLIEIDGDGSKRYLTLSNLAGFYLSTIFASISDSVTNGDSHDHVGGDGADIKGVYVPITPVDLVDSAANSWAPFAAPTGTYTFRPQDNSNAWPTTASALHALILGRWATASNSSILSLRQTSGGTNHIQLRAVSATVGLNVNGNISLDGSGYFYAVVEGANMSVAVVRVLGYYR